MNDIEKLILDDLKIIKEDIKKLNHFKWEVMGIAAFLSTIIPVVVNLFLKHNI